jgi:hypothetical protein
MNGAEGNAGSIPLADMQGVYIAPALEPPNFKHDARVAVRQAMVPLLVLAWLALGFPGQFSSRAAPAEEAAASPAASYTADLNHQETDEVLISRPVGIRLQTAPFQKEPALPGQSVFRGSLLWGPRSEQAMSFVWDKGRGRLLLDLNRNRDLTDDPKGIFVSASRDNNQSFTNIHLALPAGTGDRAVRLQLQFNSYQDGSVNVYAGLCSYWQAKVSLRGTDWQFGLVESLLEDKTSAAPLYLLLRPWTERQRAFNLATSTPDFCLFTTNVFFGNRAYALDYRCYGGGDSAKYQVTFKEQAPQLGELNVTGTGLHRLILTSGRGLTALLDQPQGTVKLPIGSYSLDEIWLRQGETEVLRLNAGRVALDEQRPANLVAGGPLTNSVEGKSQGGTLWLRYQLLGADGGAYQVPRPDHQHPPEFAVFQGTNRLATGKFQYG